MSWHIPPGQFRGIGGLDLPSLGIPAEREYIGRYCERTGRKEIDPAHWDFYMAYNLFRIAAILPLISPPFVVGLVLAPVAEAELLRAAEHAATRMHCR
jgi:aminoglycoside phosphotransferase (APT) family kinase protein